MLFLLFISTAIILVICGRVIVNTHNELVPLKNAVLEMRANLEGFQSSAVSVVERLQGCIQAFQSYEGPLLREYITTMKSAQWQGLSGAKAITVVQSFAPPSTQAAPMFQTLMNQLMKLEDDFQRGLLSYNAAVSRLNNRKGVFPANLFSGEFFSIPDAIYLRSEERQLLPPSSVASLLDKHS